MERFRNSNQIRAFMKKEAKRLNININNAYITFVAREFLEKLSRVDNGTILVKGSSAETAYLGGLVRGITDVDIASTRKIEFAAPMLRKLVEDDKDVKFSVERKVKKTPSGIYQIPFDATFDKMKQPLGVDFQDQYKRLIKKEKRIMPKIFEGDEEFEITTPSFEEYLAEKLCIILESNKPDLLNTRVKDFYDIYQLHGGKYDPDKLTRYFKRMLELRGKIKIEDASTSYLDRNFVMNHDHIWDSTKEKYDFLDSEIDLQGAVYYVRAVLREELHNNGQITEPLHEIRKKR